VLGVFGQLQGAVHHPARLYPARTGGGRVTLELNLTTIITGAIGAFVLGVSNGIAIVVANRYTVRFLDRLERNGKIKEG
jgi:hypothetical protein